MLQYPTSLKLDQIPERLQRKRVIGGWPGRTLKISRLGNFLDSLRWEWEREREEEEEEENLFAF